MRLSVSTDGITQARHALVAWARDAGCDPDLVQRIELAGYEALANAGEHAYPDGVGTVELTAVYDGGRVSITVVDRGHWRPPPADPGTRGHGLPLIERLADRAEIGRGPNGTSVRMLWNTAPPDERASGYRELISVAG